MEVPDINAMKCSTQFNQRTFKYLKMTRNACGQLKPVVKSLSEMPPEEVRQCKKQKRDVWLSIFMEKTVVE
jgi:hypothetical protein